MTTPTTMITSMITTATTMMTNVVVTPSVGRLVAGCVLLLTMAVLVVVIVHSLMVGCMLLLIGTVLVMVIASSAWGAEVTPTVWEEVGFNSVHRKHTS